MIQNLSSRFWRTAYLFFPALNQTLAFGAGPIFYVVVVDHLGLFHIGHAGVNLCRLEPGSGSSHRHWHHNEDEFVYVLEGEVVLIEDEGETVLKPGDAATFKAGVANGHTLVNRGKVDALILEVGTRSTNEIAEYSDVDMRAVATGRVMTFTRKDGISF